jgi:hypothetical protein
VDDFDHYSTPCSYDGYGLNLLVILRRLFVQGHESRLMSIWLVFNTVYENSPYEYRLLIQITCRVSSILSFVIARLVRILYELANKNEILDES